MAKTEISITRALVDLKRFEDRINSAITNGKFIARTIGRNANKKVVGSTSTVADAMKQIQGSYDKVAALFKNRETIKKAIVLSNATTKVKVLNREMTVAEAIELKSTVRFRSQLLAVLKSQLTLERNNVAKSETALEDEIEKALTAAYGSERAKLDQDTLKGVAELRRDQKEQAVLGTELIEAKIIELEAEILDITSEIDFVLSESNAKTTVTVDLDATE